MLLLGVILGTPMHLGGRPHPLLPAGAHPPGVGALAGGSDLLPETLTGVSLDEVAKVHASYLHLEVVTLGTDATLCISLP